MQGAVRVLLVNDSATARAALRLAIEESSGLSVVDEASHGADAAALTIRHNPSVVLMDVVMPKVNGYEATREIMRSHPTPIVLVSTIVDSHDISVAMEALRCGALAITDGLPSPRSPDYPARRAALIGLLKGMSHVNVTKSPSRRPSLRPTPTHPVLSPLVIGVASSTGGPQALVSLLGKLSAREAPPILIVQHLSPGFVEGFASWLGRATGHNVVIARHGDALSKGTVYVAPDDYHLATDASGRIVLNKADRVGAFRPSGTFLFESLARSFGSRAVGVILSGMGDDATAGATSMRKAGGYIIAQDQATSVVFGMARDAIARGAVNEVLPLSEIGPRLMGTETM